MEHAEGRSNELAEKLGGLNLTSETNVAHGLNTTSHRETTDLSHPPTKSYYESATLSPSYTESVALPIQRTETEATIPDDSSQPPDYDSDYEDEKELLHALQAKADEAWKAGRASEAERIAGRVTKRAGAAKWRNAFTAESLCGRLAIARVQNLQGQFAQAKTTCLSNIAEAQNLLPMSTQIMNIYLETHELMWHCCLELGDTDSAEEHNSRGLKLIKQQHGKTSAPYYRLLNLKVHILRSKEQYDEAQVYLDMIPMGQRDSRHSQSQADHEGTEPLPPVIPAKVADNDVKNSNDIHDTPTEMPIDIMKRRNSGGFRPADTIWVDISKDPRDYNPKRKWMHACEQGDMREIRHYLLSGIDVNERVGTDHRIGLHWAAMHGQTEACKVLVEAGSEVDARDKYLHCTPLHIACSNGNVDTVKYLVEIANADTTLIDVLDQTPLLRASQSGKLATIEYLLTCPPPPTDEIRSVCAAAACESRDLKSIQLLSKDLKPEMWVVCKNRRQRTALHRACYANYYPAVAHILMSLRRTPVTWRKEFYASKDVDGRTAYALTANKAIKALLKSDGGKTGLFS